MTLFLLYRVRGGKSSLPLGFLCSCSVKTLELYKFMALQLYNFITL